MILDLVRRQATRVSSFSPIILTPRECRLLGVGHPTPALLTRRVTTDSSGVTVAIEQALLLDPRFDVDLDGATHSAAAIESWVPAPPVATWASKGRGAVRVVRQATSPAAAIRPAPRKVLRGMRGSRKRGTGPGAAERVRPGPAPRGLRTCSGSPPGPTSARCPCRRRCGWCRRRCSGRRTCRWPRRCRRTRRRRSCPGSRLPRSAPNPC